MASFKDQSERASQNEILNIQRLAKAMSAWQMPEDQKIYNLPIFLRRQEISYILAKWEVFKQIQPVKGNIYYFGVYYGAGFVTLANFSAAIEPFNHTREIIGFDTFEGYPAIGAGDLSGREFDTLKTGGFSAQEADKHLLEIIKLYDENRPLGHIPKVKLIKGDVMETLPRYLAENKHALASMVYLTMNLYEPTRLAIELLWPKMPKGGIVVIHSLNEEYYPGATSALLDALGSDCEIRTIPYAPNMAYVVKGR